MLCKVKVTLLLLIASLINFDDERLEEFEEVFTRLLQNQVRALQCSEAVLLVKERYLLLLDFYIVAQSCVESTILILDRSTERDAKDISSCKQV